MLWYNVLVKIEGLLRISVRSTTMLDALKRATQPISSRAKRFFERSDYIRGAPKDAGLIEDSIDAEIIIEELVDIWRDRKGRIVSYFKADLSLSDNFWTTVKDTENKLVSMSKLDHEIRALNNYNDVKDIYNNIIDRYNEDINNIKQLERLIDDFILAVMKADPSSVSILSNYLIDDKIKQNVMGNDCLQLPDRLGRKKQQRYCLAGLALSGGGIRSATFILGILQKLAAENVLKNFDYISSVSGGGFIGGGLLWWLRRNRREKEPETDLYLQFPYGIENPSDGPYKSTLGPAQVLSYLRRSGNYLIPGNGITLWSGVVAVVRAILLNLIVWIPLSMGTFIILYYVDWSIFGENRGNVFYTPLSVACAGWAIFSLYCLGHGLVSTKKIPPSGPIVEMRDLRRFTTVALATIFYFLAVAVVGNEVLISKSAKFLGSIKPEAITQELMQNINSEGVDAFVIFMTVLLGILILLVPASLSIRGVFDSDESEEAGYIARRAFERYFGQGFIPFIVLIAIATIPGVYQWLGDSFAKAGIYGVLSVSVGAATAIFGHLKARDAKGGSRLTEVTLIGGAVLLIYGIALIGYGLSDIYLRDSTSSLVRAVLLSLFVISIFSGLLTNINGIALHQFYRDRLMEAFMPDYESVRRGVNGPAREADNFMLKDIKSPELFPIINTNVILVKSTVRKYFNRGGDNFALTPKRCGSNATGWSKTKDFRGGNLSLATAIAISGAAANPNTAVGGAGVTRNRVVSLAMLLLALRLGYWVESAEQRSKRIAFKNPNHFYPACVYSWGLIGYDENSHFLELSDGGHFENLGLYELVRRRCGVIVLCDGGRDALASYSDFITAIRRVEEDFGAQFVFEENYGPELLISSLPDRSTPTYPRGAEYSRQGYFLARIKYHNRGGKPWPEEGLLIYLKSAMIEDVSLKVKGYKGAHPDFPDESTGDQFFDEEQFEAYRELGYRIACDMIADLKEAGVFKEIFEKHAEWSAEKIVKAWATRKGRAFGITAMP
jgi:hypothetical protein